jgi:hypothetical protein
MAEDYAERISYLEGKIEKLEKEIEKTISSS